MPGRIWFRSISALICLMLATTLAPAASANTRPLAAPPNGDAKAKVAESPDRVSAMTNARAQGSRVEDLSARTPTTSTYARPDGTWSLETYAGVVRSKVDADTWVPIDPSLEKRVDGFAPKAVPFDAAFSDGGDKKVGSVTTPGGSAIQIGWPSKLPAPKADGDTLTYSDAAAPGADLVVNSYRDGFDYSVVLDQVPAERVPQVEYRIPFSFDGLTPTVNPDGSVVFREGKRRVATMTAPVMWDSAPPTDGAEHAETQPVAVSIEGTGDARTLVLKPDMDYLRDPARTWPVVVDPQVTLAVAGDTWVANTLVSTSQHTSPELRVGSSNLGITQNRTFLDFDYTALDSIPAGAQIAEAQLSLSNFQTGNCAGTDIRMSRVTGTWTMTGVTWGNQPAVTADGSSTTTDSYGATACPTETAVNFDAAEIVTAWLGTADRRGVRIAADNVGTNAGFRKYRSLENGDTAKAPKLTVIYGARPNTPTGLTVGPGYNGYTTTLTPKLSAVVTDPDAGQVRGYFEVKSGSTVVWSGYSPMATSGSRVDATVPTGVLSEGGTYTVKAFGDDGELQSTEATAATTFKVDSIAPTATISSGTYTNATWYTGSPTSGSFTANGSADTGGFYITVDGVSAEPAGANSSGDFTTTWTPPAGWHTIEAAPVDKAGNRGATATFSFGVGTAAFTAPNLWASSPSTFPIDMSAKPNATGATLSWRVATESTWRAATQVTVGGTSWNGSVTSAGGRSKTSNLLWDAGSEPFGSGTLNGPGLLEIRGCFHYASAADSCTEARYVTLVASAWGGLYPQATVGPATVAFFTGDAMVSDVDAADSKAGVGRAFTSFDDATLTAGVFGPGWSDSAILAPSDDAKAVVVDNRSLDGSFVIIDGGSGSQTFIKKAGSGSEYVPLQPTGDATALTFIAGSGGGPDRLELSRPLGTGSVTTTWTLKLVDGNGTPEWTFDAVDSPGTNGDVLVESASSSQRPIWIRESEPGAAATCTATTQTAGCRGLRITYTGTGTATRVASVDRLIGAPTPGAVTAKALATYNYDGSGRLASVCSGIPSVGKPPLCTSYAYTVVSGRTLLSQMTPTNLKAWRFSYDSIGRLTTVRRERPGGGDATWTVDYDMALTESGLPNLSAGATAQWGQQTVPSKVFAVYEPFSGSADVTKGQLYYTTKDGTLTNTASHGPAGWLVDTRWYDSKGNQIQHLDGTGWARVQAAPSGQRLQVAAEASSYMVYNSTWGEAGTRPIDEYGPAHTATLKDGTVGLFRTHTRTTYDDDPDVDPALVQNRPQSADRLGLVVQETTSVSDASRTVDYDSQMTRYSYGAQVAGDGNGWVLGKPTRVSIQVDGSTWSHAFTRYDASGREIESRHPGGATDSSGAGNDAHSTITTYYTGSGLGDCGGQPAWRGLVCKVGPAGQPTGPSVPTTYYADFNEDLRPTTVQEVSGGVVTRTATTSYDNLGRPIGSSKVTSGAGIASDTILVEYDFEDNTGLLREITSDGKAVTFGYDAWGRRNSYTDALGTSSEITFDDTDKVATLNDGSATYTYNRDDRGALTSVDAGGGAGTFTYGYAANGDFDTITYPNGVVAKRHFDEIGTQTGLTYTQGTTTLLDFSAMKSTEGRTTATSSAESIQDFTYDGLGRLTKVEDKRAGICTTRRYGFDLSSNRTSRASYSPEPNGTCQGAIAEWSESHTYDSAGRLRDAGYTYDTLGRTLTVPQTDAGLNAAGALTATYRADDMVATLSQNVLNGSGGSDSVVMAYGLDPSERIHTITKTTGGNETERLRYRFVDDGDSPASVDTSADGGNSWVSVRYVAVPGLGMAATSGSGATTYRLGNLHGDLVASMGATIGSTMISSYAETDEYGNPGDNQPTARYGWLGSHQRSTDSLGGLTLMGARLYNPSTGMFLSVDPIRDGGASVYGYPTDPINMMDLDGNYWGEGVIKAAGRVLKWVGTEALYYALQKGLGYVLAALACSAFVKVCQVFIDAVMAFGMSMFRNVVLNGRSVKQSWPIALNTAMKSVTESIFAMRVIPVKKMRKTVPWLRKQMYRVYVWLRDEGFVRTAGGVLTGLSSLVDWLYNRYLGPPPKDCYSY